MRSKEILRSADGETSETKYEGGQQQPVRDDSQPICLKENFVVAYSTGNSPFINSFSTSAFALPSATGRLDPFNSDLATYGPLL
jgi:hypothetical protein